MGKAEQGARGRYSNPVDTELRQRAVPIGANQLLVGRLVPTASYDCFSAPAALRRHFPVDDRTRNGFDIFAMVRSRASASLRSGGIGKYTLADPLELAKIDASRMSANDDSWEHALECARMRQGSCLHDIECHVSIIIEIRFPRLDILVMR